MPRPSRTTISSACVMGHSSKMRPTISALDPVNVRYAQAICVAYFSQYPRVSPDRSRYSFGNLGSSFGKPPLPGHIHHVISVCAHKEMIRVDARRHVAFVADEQACGNWAIGERPREAMRSSDTAFPPQSAIALLVPAAKPENAAPIIWWSSVKRKALRKSPVRLNHVGSHDGTSDAVVGQGRRDVGSVGRPAPQYTLPLHDGKPELAKGTAP